MNWIINTVPLFSDQVYAISSVYTNTIKISALIDFQIGCLVLSADMTAQGIRM